MQPPPADAPVGTDPALAHVFEPGGTLARTLPGFRFRARAGGAIQGPSLSFTGQCATMSSARRTTASITFKSCGSE